MTPNSLSRIENRDLKNRKAYKVDEQERETSLIENQTDQRTLNREGNAAEVSLPQYRLLYFAWSVRGNTLF
jgi:hypothetical protein